MTSSHLSLFHYVARLSFATFYGTPSCPTSFCPMPPKCNRNYANYMLIYAIIVWFYSAVVERRTGAWWSRGWGFESHPRCCGVSHSRTPASVTKHYNLVLVEGHWFSEARKVTIGLALYWPCVTRLAQRPLISFVSKGFPTKTRMKSYLLYCFIVCIPNT